MQDIEVAGTVMALTKAVCASLHTRQGVEDIAEVILAIAGTAVEEMDKHVDKMRLVPCVPGT